MAVAYIVYVLKLKLGYEAIQFDSLLHCTIVTVKLQ